MSTQSLEAIARGMVAPGRGILAADESTGTIERRFKSINVENTEENRRAYRDLLFAAKGVGQFISGAILYDETLRQKSADGTPFPQLLEKQGVLPGIKVDTGAKDMALCPGRDGDRGARQSSEALRRVREAGREVRQVARGDHHRRRHPLCRLHRRQRARARPLRRHLPGRRVSCPSSSPKC